MKSDETLEQFTDRVYFEGGEPTEGMRLLEDVLKLDKEFTIWESSKGVLHGTPPKGQRKHHTLCGIYLYEGWNYRGIGTPTCLHCLRKI